MEHATNSGNKRDDKRTMHQKIAAFAISPKSKKYNLKRTKIVLYAISELFNYYSEGHLPLSVIIKQSGLAENTVKKYLDILNKQGLIKVFERSGKDSMYVLDIPYVSDNEVSAIRGEAQKSIDRQYVEQ